MSAQWDARREAGWKAAGNARVTARVSGEAHDALALLAAHYGLDQRLVVQGLLLAAGAVLLRSSDADVIETMQQHRMSRPEAVFFRQMLDSQLTTRLNQQEETQCN